MNLIEEYSRTTMALREALRRENEPEIEAIRQRRAALRKQIGGHSGLTVEQAYGVTTY